MIAGAGMLHLDNRNALRIYRRDRSKHKSPNAGRTESVCAGALHIQLGGDASYFGKIVKKPPSVIRCAVTARIFSQRSI